MFREMRRNEQLMSAERTDEIMRKCSYGILACHGDEDYPYAVPLNYVYTDKKIYFHTAKSGHKIDAISRSAKVSFAAVAEDTIVSERYSTYFRSAIAFGRARVAIGEERLHAFQALAEKYAGDRPEEEREHEINNCDTALIIAIDIEHITGKEAKELVDADSI